MFGGVWAGTMCLTEPDAGSNLATSEPPPIQGRSLQDQRGKDLHLLGDHDLTENIVHLVLARMEAAPKGSGISLFVVPNQGQSDGSLVNRMMSSVKGWRKTGLHASPTCELTFGGRGIVSAFYAGMRTRAFPTCSR